MACNATTRPTPRPTMLSSFGALRHRPPWQQHFVEDTASRARRGATRTSPGQPHLPRRKLRGYSHLEGCGGLSDIARRGWSDAIEHQVGASLAKGRCAAQAAPRPDSGDRSPEAQPLGHTHCRNAATTEGRNADKPPTIATASVRTAPLPHTHTHTYTAQQQQQGPKPAAAKSHVTPPDLVRCEPP